jgi:hypothetical protein
MYSSRSARRIPLVERVGYTRLRRLGRLPKLWLRDSNSTGGDCPNFAESSEQNGTVPFSQTVLLESLRLLLLSIND